MIPVSVVVVLPTHEASDPHDGATILDVAKRYYDLGYGKISIGVRQLTYPHGWDRRFTQWHYHRAHV